MKYVKLFEEFKSRQEIIEICTKYKIENYTINDDGTIDVNGNVDLYDIKLIDIPLKFRNVEGNFNCSWNNLTSLDGAPSSIGGNFYCPNNELKSLEGAPSYVRGFFNCYNNKLLSLKGISKKIGDGLSCNHNPLYSFEYFPDYIDGEIILPDNLQYIFSLFDYNKELIDAFNDYNIIKAPKNKDDKPRLKVSNLNKFLSDNGFNELKDTSELEKYYELK